MYKPDMVYKLNRTHGLHRLRVPDLSPLRKRSSLASQKCGDNKPVIPLFPIDDYYMLVMFHLPHCDQFAFATGEYPFRQ